MSFTRGSLTLATIVLVIIAILISIGFDLIYDYFDKILF
jgi:4-hydroxybenzoate polyprenyltransferase